MGKIALITGASRGIGRQIARDFAAHGYGVVINYFKNRQAALQLQEELGSSALAVQADISDPEAVANMVQQAQAHFGDVDVLINGDKMLLIVSHRHSTLTGCSRIIRLENGRAFEIEGSIDGI